METPEQVERKVVALVAGQMSTDASEVGRDTRLVGDLLADSLDSVQLILALERTFHMPISEPDRMQTVGQVVDYVLHREATPTA